MVPPDFGRGRRRTRLPSRFAVLAIIVLAAAYGASRLGFYEWPRRYDPLALPDLTENPSFMTQWQMKLVDANVDNCLIALSRAGVASNLRPDVTQGLQCGKSGAVGLRHLSTAKLRPEDTRCAIAARLYMWERNVLQPAARRLLGEDIVEIVHYGSYQCRTIHGSSSMSEHSTANAFDISGFKTRSGKTLSVLRDWRKPTPAGQLLTVAHDGLCDWFNLTLSPDYNADHADHFHVDMGNWRNCR